MTDDRVRWLLERTVAARRVTTAAPAVQQINTPPAQLANASGLGWLPSIDSSLPRTPLPAAQRCLQDLGTGVNPAGPADRYFALSIDVFSLYEAALRRTSGATDPTSIGPAIAAQGSGFAASAAHGELTDFGGARRIGPAQGRLFAWSAACGCFDYSGEPFSLLTG